MKRTFILAVISIIVAVFLCFMQFIVFAFTVKTARTESASKSIAASFSFVRGHKQGKNIAVTWGMNGNSGISYFIVECTYEDPSDPYSVWRTVGMVPCSPQTPIFKIIDSPVLPGTLNYRIIAVLNNNNTVTSEIYTTYIQ